MLTLLRELFTIQILVDIIVLVSILNLLININILKKEKQLMAIIDDLGVEVARCTTVVGSAIALITGMAAKIEELKSDPIKLQAYADELRADADALAAKVTENTPAA